MQKQTWLKYLNIILGIAFIGAAGAIFTLKSGIVSGSVVVEIYEICGILLIIGILGHLTLNWTWVKKVYFSSKSKD